MLTRDEMDLLVEDGARTAVKNVCGIMLGCEAAIGVTRRMRQPVQTVGGIVTLVGMAGPWKGTGALTCAPEVACRLAGALLATEYPSVTEEVLDAMGELANMVVGNLKTGVEDRVGAIGLSTPTTVFGASFAAKIGGGDYWMLVPIRVCDGDLQLQVCLIPNDC